MEEYSLRGDSSGTWLAKVKDKAEELSKEEVMVGRRNAFRLMIHHKHGKEKEKNDA